MDSDMSRIPPAPTELLSDALLPNSCHPRPYPRRDECPPKREALRQELGMEVRGTGTPITTAILSMTRTPHPTLESPALTHANLNPTLNYTLSWGGSGQALVPTASLERTFQTWGSKVSQSLSCPP